MKVLAIETSTRAWSVAVLDGAQILARPEISSNLPISKALLPQIQAAIVTAGLTPNRLDLIAVSLGPGAFTGLRVGITAAKTLAYAVGCPLVACSSLEVLAAAVAVANDWQADQEICVIIDAQRGEFYFGRFRFRSPWAAELVSPVTIKTPQALAAESWNNTLLTGSALLRWTPTTDTPLAARMLWQPDASVLGQLAQHYFERGVSHDPFALVPEYVRPSYAEEKKPPFPV